MDDNRLPALRLSVVQLVIGIGHSRSNIAAIHFDGPWFDECMRLAREMQAVNSRDISPKVS